MNLAGQGEDPSCGVFFVNFNQDNTSLAVGTTNGFKLFSLSNVDNLEQMYESGSEDICIVERLFSSSLVALVHLSSPRKLRIIHFKKGHEICNYSYSNTILAVKLNRARLIVCLEESLYIHNIRDMTVLHTIRDTPPNPLGICALTTNPKELSLMAYPGSSTIGEVQIFDAEHLSAKLMIPAHDNPLAALSFDRTGTKIATASDKGTVIRVFSVVDGTKLYEFRRGMKRCVSIYSLAFSEDSLFLCASSNTETVHIFKLEDITDPKPPEEPQGWMGYVGRAIMTSTNYLPTQVTDILNQGRAFATIKLPFQGLRNICAIITIKGVARVVVAAADGYMYIYNLEPNQGGECTLEKQHRLDGKQEPVEIPKIQGAEGETVPSGSPPSIATTVPSYASTVQRNVDKGPTSEAEKVQELTAAADMLAGTLRLTDEDEFPPMGGKRT